MTNDVSGAVKAAKSGRVDFKIDKTAIVHVGLGKVWRSTLIQIALATLQRYWLAEHLQTYPFTVSPYYFICFLQVNFSEESLRENVGAFVHALLLAKPVGLKKSK